MKNMFLASVGVATAFVRRNGKLEHFFTAKTLSDSAINISVSAEEIRGGQGGQLLGQFFHTSTFGLTLTDVMFHLEYIAAQVGTEIRRGGKGLIDVTLTSDENGVLTLPAGTEVAPLLENENAVVWYNAPGDDLVDTAEVTVAEGGEVTVKLPGGTASGNREWCVHYFANREDARYVIVNANFAPQELILYLTTRLFSGDGKTFDMRKPAGSVTVEIPRFQLNGTADLSLAMTSAASIQLQGNAMAVTEGCEDSWYAKIIEYRAVSEFDGYTNFVIIDGTNVVGSKPVIYAVGDKKTPMLIDNNMAGLVYAPEGTIEAPLFNADGTLAQVITGITYKYKEGDEEKTISFQTGA